MPTLNVPKSACGQLHGGFHPDDVTDDVRLFLRNAVQTLICDAIDDGIPPAPLPIAAESGFPMNISFTKDHDRAIRALSRERKIREGDAALSFLFAALARGDALDLKKSVTESVLHHYVSALGLVDRHHQNLFAESLIASLLSKGVGMVEGSTGIGKTLGMVVAGAHVLKDRAFGRTLIAVPTLALLRQFAHQHQALSTAVPDFPGARFVLGKNEFVCVGDLIALLDSGTLELDSSAIRSWIARGGQASDADAAIDRSYLVTSLLAISPEFPVDAVRCSSLTDTNDLGLAGYRDQFFVDDSGELENEVVYCTHAMLAADIRRRMFGAKASGDGQAIRQRHQSLRQDAMGLRKLIGSDDGQAYRDAGMDIKNSIDGELYELALYASENDVGILPPWQYLLVDEAHLFESNLANAFSFNLSLGRFLQHISTAHAEGAISASAVKRASSALKIIRNAGVNNEDINLKSTAPNAMDVCAALKELQAIVETRRATGINSPTLQVLRAQTKLIRTALRISSTSVNGRSLVCYSPIRAYPQLSVGRASVSAELAFLWHSTEAAACVSATLYLRRMDKDSPAYMAGILNIPSNRLQEFPVIRPHWVTAPVVGLWTPEAARQPSGRLWLRPPSRSDKLDAAQFQVTETQWLDEVASVTRGIHHSAGGGVLVLMTSYSSAKGLATRLDELPSVVLAEQGISISRQVATFAQSAADGHKPIWIAVGGAWTGVDINGKNYGFPDPAKDNLLTDLIVPRFPFGTNMSMTHRHRSEQASSVPWDLLDAAMRFKQGLGRLIRREGLPKNRRIFVLDGRINDPSFDFFLSHLRRIIGIYPVKTLSQQFQDDQVYFD